MERLKTIFGRDLLEVNRMVAQLDNLIKTVDISINHNTERGLKILNDYLERGHLDREQMGLVLIAAIPYLSFEQVNSLQKVYQKRFGGYCRSLVSRCIDRFHGDMPVLIGKDGVPIEVTDDYFDSLLEPKITITDNYCNTCLEKRIEKENEM